MDISTPNMGNIVYASLLLLILKDFCFVAAKQSFEKPPQYTEVDPTADAKLECKVFNKRGHCSWQKDNKPVGMQENKYEWAGSEKDGDCSIWIRHAQLEFDDGLWECQVTASDFMTQDALTSTPAKLVVRAAPQEPRIEFNGSLITPSRNVSARIGDTVTVKCVSKHGNPPANIRWLLGDKDITGQSSQTNASAIDHPRTWIATSMVTIILNRDLHKEPLRCVAVHEAYSTKSSATDVRLDVHYPPEVKLVGIPMGDLEENRDRVLLRCQADANPPATVTWEAPDRPASARIVSSQEDLQFLPVTRANAGRYICTARNSVGSSLPAPVTLDVKYAPRVTSVEPKGTQTAMLYSSVTYTCKAEGNPEPTYQWLQKLPMATTTVIIRGSQAKLHIANVTYEHQGEYVCKVTNIIGDSERSVQSDSVKIKVRGAPQILRSSISREVSVLRGQDALVRMIVCSDPLPTRVLWQWGSLQIEPGAGSGKFQAEDLRKDERDDCYEARFHIHGADLTDARKYALTVANDRGEDSHAVMLAVRGEHEARASQKPVSMTTLLSVASGCLLLLLLLVLLSVYAVRREKCCFARRGDFRPADLESEKSDVDSTSGKKTPRIDGNLGNNAVVGIGPDHHYGHHSPSHHHRIPQHITAGDPEAMKVRLAAMVLQAPTRV